MKNISNLKNTNIIFLYNGSLSSLNERVAGSRTAGINDKEKPDFITR